MGQKNNGVIQTDLISVRIMHDVNSTQVPPDISEKVKELMERISYNGHVHYEKCLDPGEERLIELTIQHGNRRYTALTGLHRIVAVTVAPKNPDNTVIPQEVSSKVEDLFSNWNYAGSFNNMGVPHNPT